MTEFFCGSAIVRRSRAEQERINRMLSPLDLPAIRSEVARIYKDLLIRRTYYRDRLTNMDAAFLFDVLEALMAEAELLRTPAMPTAQNEVAKA